MKLENIALSFVFSFLTLLNNAQEGRTAYNQTENDFKVIKNQAPFKRNLESGNCSTSNQYYDSNSRQCQCLYGFFGQACEINAISLPLDDYISANLYSLEKMYFYLDLPNQEADLTLSMMFVPLMVKVSLGQPSPNNFYLPDANTTFATYESPGTKDWEIGISYDSLKFYSIKRLFVCLQSNQQTSANVKIKISFDDSSKMLTYLLIIGVIGGFINVIGCAYLIKYKLRRKLEEALRQESDRNNYNNSSIPAHMNHTDPDELVSLQELDLCFPKTNFDQLKSCYVQAECPICLEEYKPDTICRQLYCDHIFHPECIELWLQKQSLFQTCPTCKKKMTRRLAEEYHARIKENKKEETVIIINSNKEEQPQKVQNIDNPQREEYLPEPEEHKGAESVTDLEKAMKM